MAIVRTIPDSFWADSIRNLSWTEVVSMLTQALSHMTMDSRRILLEWFKTGAEAQLGRVVCWQQGRGDVINSYVNLLAFITSALLSPRSAEELIPLRFKDLPPGYIDWSVPQLFSGNDYTNEYLDYISATIGEGEPVGEEVNAWFERANKRLDRLGGRLGRTMFATFKRRYDCRVRSGCHPAIRPGMPHKPFNARGALLFFRSVLGMGQAFMVTAGDVTEPSDIWWLDSGLLAPSTEAADEVIAARRAATTPGSLSVVTHVYSTPYAVMNITGVATLTNVKGKSLPVNSGFVSLLVPGRRATGGLKSVCATTGAPAIVLVRGGQVLADGWVYDLRHDVILAGAPGSESPRLTGIRYSSGWASPAPEQVAGVRSDQPSTADWLPPNDEGIWPNGGTITEPASKSVSAPIGPGALDVGLEGDVLVENLPETEG
ncbi:hypothetical protein CDD81_690 [Ophiocordyceps australis]|uniref:Uncharacterized protein n=1 Tax=Ophiocordyceps australis TaxID=1399860 RepID=A0A2C5X8H0_9HYPO|nr:hypothetical protein CDD81_690 [Ophiocordyceps australis]